MIKYRLKDIRHTMGLTTEIYPAKPVDARIKELEKIIRHKNHWLRIIKDDAEAHCLKGYVEMADIGLKH